MKEYYKIKKVSNSSLSWFQKSPKYFKMMFDKEIEEGTKSYFEKGEQIHQYLLEPEEFDKNYIFLDYETPRSAQQKSFCETFAHSRKGTEDERLVAGYKKNYTTKESDEKILDKAKELAKTYSSYIKFIKTSPMYTSILSSSMRDQLNETRIKVLDHIKAKELLFNEDHNMFGNTDKFFAVNEFAIYWELPDDKGNKMIECKSLLDRLVIDFENKKVTMIDLKTTSHLPEFKEKFNEYRYYRQLSFYWFAVTWYFINVLKLNIDEFIKETYIVAIASSSPVEVKVFEVSEPQLNKGMNEMLPLLRTIAWHFKEDKWDYSQQYYDGITTERL